MSTPRVLISILNWNKAAITFECLSSLQKMVSPGIKIDIFILDNGSKPDDYELLLEKIDADNVRLERSEINLGFTGGHNVALKFAITQHYDFIWLLNNDATVHSDTLSKLVEAITNDARCGAVSPVIYAEDGVGHYNAWGVTHDWKTRSNRWMPSAEASILLHNAQPEQVCLAGTAILFRVQAIREIGLLDDRLFAYFDDNDIGTRLAKAGWYSKVVFEADTTHGARTLAEQPLYYFYLMFRNEMLFWHTHTPKEYRNLLWLKLLDQGLFNINRLHHMGMHKQAESGLLGVWDFLCGRYGAPDISRRAPLAMRLLCKMLALVQNKHISRLEVAATVQG